MKENPERKKITKGNSTKKTRKLEIIAVNIIFTLTLVYLKVLEINWVELFLLTWYLLDIHAQKLMKLKHFTSLTFYCCSPTTHKSNIPSYMLYHGVVKWSSTNVTLKTNTQSPSRYFCVFLELRMWIVI